MTKQPRWKRIANLGDVNPIEYGGVFVYVDRTHVYDPEIEVLETNEVAGDKDSWTIYRWSLDRCTLINGILSDNKYHPEMSAWFAPSDAEIAARPQDSNLNGVASFVGEDVDSLKTALCSKDVIERAFAYKAIADYYGLDNFDSYPRTYIKRSELPRRIRRAA